jgi:hypothetical protein
LTVTYAGSSRNGEYALLNNAHRRVKEQTAHAYALLPFPTPGIDSGGGFINR